MQRSTQLDTATTTTGTTRLPDSLCTHTPHCPAAHSPDREAAQTIASHPEQGWSRLCNGVLVFDDTGDLLPDGQIVNPHRPTDGALSFRLTDAHALIGGTSGSGKTSAAAAMHKAGVLAGTAVPPRLA
ncbi:DUF5999 family protein [Streptomyces sp. S1D4-14]|uniref:DUF5999 family protein n=1 Tax=Streptomyces sp. S1D4-14 TaxID=2594461 RepID=UPI00116258BE|nr:hypothetical protein FNV66_00235 [Streptomyces sp. S1D4-14]